MTKKIVSIILALPLLFVLTAKNSFADASDYIIRVNYDGPVTLHRVEVLLYDTDRACNTLVEDPEDAPSPDVAYTSLVIFPEADGTIPDRGINMPSGDLLVELHYAVARASASDGAGGGTDYFVTFGCNDQIPAIDPTAATLIEINMHNLWPEVEGTYRIDVEGSLLSRLPREFRSVRKSIKEFLNTPGLGLLRLIAVSVSGEQYWQFEPWDRLFKCKGTLEDPYSDYCKKVKPTRLGKFAARIIEENVDENLASFLGVQDASIRDLLAPGGEIIALAESFDLTGNLVITQNPDSSGYLGNTNELVFNQITWYWGGNDRTLQLRDESYLRGKNIEATVLFHPDDPEAYSMEIDPLVTLTLNYAELLFWVLEGVVFPELLGANEIDSIEDIADFMDCNALSSRLLCEGPYTNDPSCKPKLGLAAEGIRAGCDSLKLSANEPISLLSSGLLVGRDTWYLIHTPPYNPCRMSFAPANDEFRINALGGSDPVDHCEWEGEMVIYPDDVTEFIEWNWWGERL